MSKTKKIFSLLSLMMVGLLFIGTGLAFAAEDLSGEEDDSRELREVMDRLSGELMHLPELGIIKGLDGFNYSKKEGIKGVICVQFIEDDEKDISLVPNFYEGYLVITRIFPRDYDVDNDLDDGRNVEVVPMGKALVVRGGSVDAEVVIEKAIALIAKDSDREKTIKETPSQISNIDAEKDVKVAIEKAPIVRDSDIEKTIKETPSQISNTSYMGGALNQVTNNKILPAIEMNLKVAEFSAPGTFTIIQPGSYNTGMLANNEILPNLQVIGMNSKIAEFSTPGTPTIQPGSPNTGMLTNNGWPLGTIPKLSLPQLFIAPTTK